MLETRHPNFLAHTCQPLLSGKGCCSPRAFLESPRCRGPAESCCGCERLWGTPPTPPTSAADVSGLRPQWTTRRAAASTHWIVTTMAAGPTRTVPTPSPAVAEITWAPASGTETAARLTSGWLEHTGPTGMCWAAGNHVHQAMSAASPLCAQTQLSASSLRVRTGGTQLLLSLARLCITSGTCPSRPGTGKSRRPCNPTLRPEARSPGLGSLC